MVPRKTGLTPPPHPPVVVTGRPKAILSLRFYLVYCNFIAGHPKAAHLFWFFGGFRCGVPLFIVMLVIY